MRHRPVLAAFLLSSSATLLVACGARTVGLTLDDFDAGGGDDTGAHFDSGGVDSHVGVDTGVAPDTFVFDSGVFVDEGIDTSPFDSGRPDTTVLDTGVIDTGFDSGPPDALGFPASHPDAPQIGSGSGSVLATPKIVPIVFTGDAWSSQISDFVTTMTGPGATDYWTATLSEYGIKPPTAAPLITVAETPPSHLTNDEIIAWLGDKLDGTHADFGAPDTNAIYTIFYPTTTTITLQPGFDSCSAFGGYHHEADLASGKKVAFAVIPRCSGFIPGATDFEGMTGATSHEWVEAATDPLFLTERGYLAPDDDHLAWEFFPGTELADMCAFESTAFFKASFGVEVQRTWSNVAAKAGQDPCVPAAAGVYFNSAPVLPDTVTIDLFDGSGPRSTKGVKIPIGSSKTIEIDLFSDAATSGPWTVQAIDIGTFLGASPSLKFSFDRTTGKNGDKLNLTITVTGDSGMGGSEFALRSSLGGVRHYWYGWVGR